MSLVRAVAVGLVCLFAGACVNPLPFGPGRMHLTQENVQLAAVPEATLFQPFGLAKTSDKQRDVVRFDFSSEIDLRHSLRDRIVQTRCEVVGGKLAKQSNWASGPYYEGTHLSLLPPEVQLKAVDGKYHYSAYAFADLSATQLIDTRFKTTPLDQLRFTGLSCFIIGVTKAPVLFPRSNNLVLSNEDFMSQLRTLRASGAASPTSP
jgi:hypothetical protein